MRGHSAPQPTTETRRLRSNLWGEILQHKRVNAPVQPSVSFKPRKVHFNSPLLGPAEPPLPCGPLTVHLITKPSLLRVSHDDEIL